MLTEAQKRADRTYKAKLDTITIRPSKEEGARIRAAAEESGQSLTAYILSKLQ